MPGKRVVYVGGRPVSQSAYNQSRITGVCVLFCFSCKARSSNTIRGRRDQRWLTQVSLREIRKAQLTGKKQKQHEATD